MKDEVIRDCKTLSQALRSDQCVPVTGKQQGEETEASVLVSFRLSMSKTPARTAQKGRLPGAQVQRSQSVDGQRHCPEPR